MDLDDILNFDRLECTGAIAIAGWAFDQDEIIEAMNMLDIKLKVKLKLHSYGPYNRGGGTHRNDTNSSHLIVMDQKAGIRNANFTLWHELVHCAQSERFTEKTGKTLKEFHREYKIGDGAHGQKYQQNIYELEANRVAAQNELMLLLAYAS